MKKIAIFEIVSRLWGRAGVRGHYRPRKWHELYFCEKTLYKTILISQIYISWHISIYWWSVHFNSPVDCKSALEASNNGWSWKKRVTTNSKKFFGRYASIRWCAGDHICENSSCPFLDIAQPLSNEPQPNQMVSSFKFLANLGIFGHLTQKFWGFLDA